MADGAFPGLVSRNRDVNAADNVIFTQVADDAGNVATITGGKLDVNATVNVENIFVDDSAFTVGTDNVGSCGYLFDDVATDSVDEGDIGIARMTADRIQLVNLQDADGDRLVIDASGFLTTNINGTVTVSAADLDIRDLTHVSDSVKIGDGTDFLAVNTDGSINVNLVSSTITGEIHDYDTAAGVAADATSNHDYTVANTVFLLKSIIVAGSGNVKFEVQTGPLASLATVAVGFLIGRQGDTKQIFFDPAIEVPVASTGTVRVIRTNRQGAATDVYSTIIGIDQ